MTPPYTAGAVVRGAKLVAGGGGPLGTGIANNSFKTKHLRRIKHHVIFAKKSVDSKRVV
jgi:hypothetical protein